MSFQPSLESGMQHRVYWITKRIVQGQFVTPERASVLSQQGITHILNVGEGGSIIAPAEFGFEAIVDVPVVDLERIPTEIALRALDAMHEILWCPLQRGIHSLCRRPKPFADDPLAVLLSLRTKPRSRSISNF